MEVKDFLLTNPDGDLSFKNGDLNIGFSDDQHIYDIIQDNPGDWKENPTVGVGVIQYVNSKDTYKLFQEINSQLIDDGYTIDELIVDIDGNDKLNITPNAVRK